MEFAFERVLQSLKSRDEDLLKAMEAEAARKLKFGVSFVCSETDPLCEALVLDLSLTVLSLHENPQNTSLHRSFVLQLKNQKELALSKLETFTPDDFTKLKTEVLSTIIESLLPLNEEEEVYVRRPVSKALVADTNSHQQQPQHHHQPQPYQPQRQLQQPQQQQQQQQQINDKENIVMIQKLRNELETALRNSQSQLTMFQMELQQLETHHALEKRRWEDEMNKRINLEVQESAEREAALNSKWEADVHVLYEEHAKELAMALKSHDWEQSELAFEAAKLTWQKNSAKELQEAKNAWESKLNSELEWIKQDHRFEMESLRKKAEMECQEKISAVVQSREMNFNLELEALKVQEEASRSAAEQRLKASHLIELQTSFKLAEESKALLKSQHAEDLNEAQNQIDWLKIEKEAIEKKMAKQQQQYEVDLQHVRNEHAEEIRALHTSLEEVNQSLVQVNQNWEQDKQVWIDREYVSRQNEEERMKRILELHATQVKEMEVVMNNVVKENQAKLMIENLNWKEESTTLLARLENQLTAKSEEIQNWESRLEEEKRSWQAELAKEKVSWQAKLEKEKASWQITFEEEKNAELERERLIWQTKLEAEKATKQEEEGTTKLEQESLFWQARLEEERASWQVKLSQQELAWQAKFEEEKVSQSTFSAEMNEIIQSGISQVLEERENREHEIAQLKLDFETELQRMKEVWQQEQQEFRREQDRKEIPHPISVAARVFEIEANLKPAKDLPLQKRQIPSLVDDGVKDLVPCLTLEETFAKQLSSKESAQSDAWDQALKLWAANTAMVVTNAPSTSPPPCSKPSHHRRFVVVNQAQSLQRQLEAISQTLNSAGLIASSQHIPRDLSLTSTNSFHTPMGRRILSRTSSSSLATEAEKLEQAVLKGELFSTAAVDFPSQPPEEVMSDVML